MGNHLSQGTEVHDPFELTSFDGGRVFHLPCAEAYGDEPFGLLGSSETYLRSGRLVVEDYDHSESMRDYYGVDLAEDHSRHAPVAEHACEIFQVQDDVGAQDYDEAEAQRHLLPAGIAYEGYDDAPPELLEGIF